jgi:hypothetical protein
MTLSVECLRCGEHHRLGRSPFRHVVDSECPRCGYLGWAQVKDLSESSRRGLRDRPVELRKLRVVA